MLGPVQRIPRYRLLLEDYLKKLPEDDPDWPNTKKALQLITIAATHSNETMKKIVSLHHTLYIPTLYIIPRILYHNLLSITFDVRL